MPVKLKSVSQEELSKLIAESPRRGRSSRGAELIEDFITSGEVAALAGFGSTKERNAISISASNYTRNAGRQVWVRKLGGGTGNELLLVNLTKADAATRKAYENRPRVGRRPSKR
jgi:hypothetical protein